MLALGLNSGPSFDGIDAVLVDIEIGEDPDEFGIPAQYKEAIKLAALALAAELHLANNIPAASGASRFAILGKLVAGP